MSFLARSSTNIDFFSYFAAVLCRGIEIGIGHRERQISNFEMRIADLKSRSQQTGDRRQEKKLINRRLQPFDSAQDRLAWVSGPWSVA